MSAESEVREVSKKFYAALNRMANGDSGPIAEVWSHSKSVTAMHPIGACDTGWNAVRESFGKVADMAKGGAVKLDDQMIQVSGDMAYEVGNETGKVTLAGKQVAIDHRVTNIYRRESGGWKMVHHHTDVSPAMLNVLAHLSVEKAV